MHSRYEDALTVADRDSKFIIPDDQFYTRLVRPGSQPRAPTNRVGIAEDNKLALQSAAVGNKSETLHADASERPLDRGSSEKDFKDSKPIEVDPNTVAQKSSLAESADRKPVIEQTPALSREMDMHKEAPLPRDALPPKSDNTPSTPASQPQTVKSVDAPRPATPLRNGVTMEPSSTTTSPVVNGTARNDKLVPREPRSSAATNENKSQQPFRSMDPPAAPRGSSNLSRQSGAPGISSGGLRNSMSTDSLDSRDRHRESQAPLAPRDVRDREERSQPMADNRGLSSRSMALPPRRLSPGRLPSSRSGSVDSKYSRASDSHRDSERRSDRRDRDRDRQRDAERERERNRDREKERDVDSRKEKEVERLADQDREHSQRSDRHRAADPDKDRRRDTRERDDRKDDKRDDKARKEDRRDRDRDRERDRRDRDRDRRDKDRNRTSRREEEREKDKEKDKDKPRDRERGERLRERDRDKERDKDRDERERPRSERSDRDSLRNGDGHRDRASLGGARDRAERGSRERPETASSVHPPQTERDNSASAVETKSSIDALSARFDAQRRHSVTDSRGSLAESAGPEASIRSMDSFN